MGTATCRRRSAGRCAQFGDMGYTARGGGRAARAAAIETPSSALAPRRLLAGVPVGRHHAVERR